MLEIGLDLMHGEEILPVLFGQCGNKTRKSHNTGDYVYICGHWPHMGHPLALLGGNGLHIV